MRLNYALLLLCVAALPGLSQAPASPGQTFTQSIAGLVPQPPKTMPLYPGDIPNSKPAPDEEKQEPNGAATRISRPTITAYLPGSAKSIHSAIIVFPGGGYVAEMSQMEGTSVAEAFQDHGVAAFLVKYRLPDDATMQDKSIGPLQDAQQAIRVVRENASQWGIDPEKIGVIGFSAGGHLAATVATHFAKSYLPDSGGANLRPNFAVLVYPVITMDPKFTHQGSRDALLGKNPDEEKVRLFSNELQVTEQTPPVLLLAATDDRLVDVENSVVFYQALHQHHVSAEMILFDRGNHGFFGLARDDWFQPLCMWMMKNGWMKP